MDVTILGCDSLRWARLLRAATAMLAGWSVLPAILGIACLSSVSHTVKSVPGGDGYPHTGSLSATMLAERPAAGSIRIHVGHALHVVHRSGWSLVSLQGTVLRGHRGLYTATRPGRAVLSAHNGNSRWRYIVTVLGRDGNAGS